MARLNYFGFKRLPLPPPRMIKVNSAPSIWYKTSSCFMRGSNTCNKAKALTTCPHCILVNTRERLTPTGVLMSYINFFCLFPDSAVGHPLKQLQTLWPITFIMQMNLNRVTLTFAVWLMLSQLSPGFLVFPFEKNKKRQRAEGRGCGGQLCQREQQAAATARYLASAHQMPTDDAWCCLGGLR